MAAPDLDMGRAWHEATAVLPLGWVIRALVTDGMTWDAIATDIDAYQGPCGFYGTDDPHVIGRGDEPVDALRDLARRLRESA